MKRVLFISAIAAVAVAWPAGASAATFRGVVVGKLRGSVLVAAPSGVVQALAGHAAVGSKVGWSDGRLVVLGHSTTARIRGIVFRRLGATMFISSSGHLIAVHTGRRLASANDTPPSPASSGTGGAPGTVVDTQVGITGSGQLDEESEDDVGSVSASTIPVQAVVSAVGIGTVTLTVNGQTLTVQLPAGLTLPSSFVGQTVTLNLSLNGDQGGSQSGDDSGDGNSGNSGDGGGD